MGKKVCLRIMDVQLLVIVTCTLLNSLSVESGKVKSCNGTHCFRYRCERNNSKCWNTHVKCSFCIDRTYGLSAANETARINCTHSITGQKMKKCSADGKYGEEEGCASNEINEILQESGKVKSCNGTHCFRYRCERNNSKCWNTHVKCSFCIDRTYGLSAANETARINCTHSITGQKMKKCSADGKYGEEEGCASNEINEILQESGKVKSCNGTHCFRYRCERNNSKCWNTHVKRSFYIVRTYGLSATNETARINYTHSITGQKMKKCSADGKYGEEEGCASNEINEILQESGKVKSCNGTHCFRYRCERNNSKCWNTHVKRSFCIDRTYGLSAANETARINCTHSITGQKMKKCSADGKYGEEEGCASNEINEILQIVLNSTELAEKLPQLVGKFNNIIKSQSKTTPGNLQASLAIIHAFSTVSDVSLELVVVEGFLSIVDSLVDVKAQSAWTSVKTENKNSSSQLLKSVEDFTRLLNPPNQTFNIIKPNIQLKGMKVEPGKDYDVDFSNLMINNRSVTNNVFISQTKLAALTKGSLVMSIAFLTMNDILSPPPTSNYKLNGLVVATTAELKSIDIVMRFMPLDSTLAQASAQCVFWNLINGSWDTEGCTHEINGSNIICRCDHLTSFSLLMSSITDFEVPPWLRMLNYVVLGTSQVSLIIGIIIEAIVWKNLTKNTTSLARHIAILNIALSLLIMNTLFCMHTFLKPKDISCKVVIFFAHFFLLSLSFWMFTLALLLLYHLVFIFSNYSRTSMMLISFILGYTGPFIIASSVFLKGHLKDHYIEKKICWINVKQTDLYYSFALVPLIIVGMNFLITFFAIVKIQRPAIGEKSSGQQSVKNSVKQILRCIIILTPLLGLSWLLGFIYVTPSTGNNSDWKEIFRPVFDIANGLQGFFILIFGIIMDKKVRECLKQRFLPQTYSQKSSAATGSTSQSNSHS